MPPEAAANDFTEEFLAPVRAVQRWYERRDVPRSVRVEDLLELANAFGISVWSALFRSRAAGRLHGKQFHVLRSELRHNEWALLPRQAFLGGLRDTLSHLTPDEALPRGESGGPAVLRVPASHARLGAPSGAGGPPEPRGGGRPAPHRRGRPRAAARPSRPGVTCRHLRTGLASG